MSPSTARRLAPRLAFVVVGACIGIVLLVLLLRSVNLDQLGAAFSHVNRAYLALAVPFYLINLFVKIPRWSLLFGEESPNKDTLFGAMNVGYAVNALLPARLGEIVRSYWVRDRGGVSMVRTLSTVALERVCDGVTLIVFLIVTAPTVAFPKRLLGSALVVGVLFIAVLVAMVVLAYGARREDHPLSRFLTRVESGRLGPVGRILRQTVTGLQALRNKRSVALLILYTAVIWLANAVLVWFILRAFHIEVPFTASVLLTAVLNLGMAVPSTPGYVGVFEYLMVLVLGLYNVAHAPAVAAALAFHAIAFVPVTLIGLAYIVRTGTQATLEIIRAGAESPASADPLPRAQGRGS